MPDLITHHLYGKQAIERMNETNKKIIERNIDLYYLGCNGPDNFFYYHVIYGDSPTKKRMNQIGNGMHSQDINEMFDVMFEYLKKHYSEALFSYVAGFIMHFNLDTTCHPFIYYFTGFSKETPKYNYYHKQLEVQIDQMLLEIMEGKKLKDCRPYQLLKFSDESLKIIYPMIQEISKKVYHLDLSFEEYKECWKDFRTIELLTGCTKPFEKNIIKWYENKTHALPFFSTAVYSPDYKEYDVLNLKRKEWVDPVDNTIHFNSTFVELFDQALLNSNNLLNLLDEFLTKGEKNYINYIGNRDFDTNHPCGKEIKYFKCIYENEE